MVDEEEHNKLKETLDKVISSYRKQSLFTTTLLLWVIALVIEVTIRTYDLYRIAPDVDILSHLFSGIAMAAGLFWLSDKWNFPHYRFAAIFGTIVISLLWELVETLQELVIKNPQYLLDFFIWDGFFDVVVAVIGATIFVLVRKNIVHKNGISY
jgi:hypothetical protein